MVVTHQERWATTVILHDILATRLSEWWLHDSRESGNVLPHNMLNGA